MSPNGSFSILSCHSYIVYFHFPFIMTGLEFGRKKGPSDFSKFSFLYILQEIISIKT